MLKPQIVLTGVMMLAASLLSAQGLRMAFVASGASPKVDSVKATNLTTNKSVMMPGTDTLLLEWSTGIPDPHGAGENGIVFPNPCNGKVILVVPSGQAQTAVLILMDLSGRVITGISTDVPQGNNLFQVTFSRTGVYLVSVQTSQGISGFKIICTETVEGIDRIFYQGTTLGNPGPLHLKNQNVYSLEYSYGDIILYRCRGGVHTTIITDTPDASKTYTVEFVTCADLSGRSYAVVKIGSQTWMAENLAWLPKVMKPDTGAENLKFYYVYGYQDTTVSEAKNTLNYINYGVLYNWPAAMNATTGKKYSGTTQQAVCPQGWHMPSDDEWKTLEMSLGMSQADADTLYMRTSGEAGMKLKSTTAWPEDTLTSNLSGFTALPGGYRNTHGLFDGKHKYSLFWTSTSSDTMSWYRCFNVDSQGVYRMTTLWSHGLSVRCVKD